MTYLDYFLNSNRNIIEHETFELSHPSFSQTRYFTKNDTTGFTATIETGQEVRFDYIPLEVMPDATKADLDLGFEIEFGDVGEILPLELDSIIADNSFTTKPELVYRVFRGDDSQNVLYGPIRLEIETVAFTKDGATIRANVRRFSLTRTGLIYRLTEFPTMRGYLE